MNAEIKVPAVGESVTEATLAEWSVASGDYVNRDDVLLSLETDKASVDIVAEHSGVITISIEEGETVNVGTVLGKIDTEAKAPTGGGDKTEAKTETEAPKTTAPASKKDMSGHLSPAVRKVMADRNLSPGQVQGSGKDGRITKANAMNATNTPVQAAHSPTPKASIPDLPQFAGGAEPVETREKMSTLRKTIAKRLVQAQADAAILTTFNEIDMTAAKALRAKYKESFKEKHGISLGFMGLFVKATCAALMEYPLVNGSIEGNEFITRNFVNMGIAVSTPKGLMVPVIKNADKLSLAEIELSIRHYALKARDGKIKIDDLSGGSFTISNGGVFGSMMSTPILNPPQSGILGLHKIEDRPIALGGEVVIRPMMYAALSYDHRIVDGKQSVGFLVKIKEGMEDPARLLLDV